VLYCQQVKVFKRFFLQKSGTDFEIVGCGSAEPISVFHGWNQQRPKSGRGRILVAMSASLVIRRRSRVARFFLVRETETGKMYEISTKCTK
jgi:hypothetical protein